MAYTPISFVFGEQPSAAKWNILGANDASFADGTGIASGAITTAKIADANVTSEKLDLTIGVRAYRNAALSVSTESDIVFDTENWDLGSDFSTGTGQFTAPVTGYYKVYAQARLTNLGDGATSNLRIYANGVNTALSTVVGASVGGDPTVVVGDTVSLTASQVAKVTIENSGSTALSVGTTSTFVTIEFVGV